MSQTEDTPELQRNFFDAAREMERLLSPATDAFYEVAMARAVQEGRPATLMALIRDCDPLLLSYKTYSGPVFHMLAFDGENHGKWACEMLAAKGGFHHTYVAGLARLRRGVGSVTSPGEENVFETLIGHYTVLCGIAKEAANCAPFKVPAERYANEPQLKK